MLFFKNLQSILPKGIEKSRNWSGLDKGSKFLAIADLVLERRGFNLLVCDDTAETIEAETTLSIYLDKKAEIISFPDWETLPYDQFSPHQDIISQRLEALAKIPEKQNVVLICASNTLMHRLPPPSYVNSQSFSLSKGDQLDVDQFCNKLVDAGYIKNESVFERGEFALRGSIIDLFPMGADHAVRLDLFDNEIDSLRSFDTESQRTIATMDSFKVLPAREIPFDTESIQSFKQSWQARFDVDPRNCPVFQDIKNHILPGGIEYFLDLFFEQTSTLFDYIPEDSLLLISESVRKNAELFWREIEERYDNLRWDINRPILEPKKIYINTEELNRNFNNFQQINFLQSDNKNSNHNFFTKPLPEISADPRKEKPLQATTDFLESLKESRVMICAQTAGRREQLLDLLKKNDIKVKLLTSIEEFFAIDIPTISLCVADIHNGFHLDHEKIIEQKLLASKGSIANTVVITETELYGYQVSQERRRNKENQVPADLLIKNLSELALGAPVVHIDHGVGRYLGLQNLNIDEQEIEFLCLEYANKAKLYVPVSSLHLISRYSGGADESAPLHTLGSDQWQKARKKAAEKIHDVAAELLDIYARRASIKGYSHQIQDEDFRKFVESFPFEETQDQVNAINACVEDMKSENPMDRLICGDVGFGKTEVAMRAAFAAVQNNKQVAVLVPTTLLSEQHGETFKDRFADWPIRVESLSRFQNTIESKKIIADLEEGKVDILVGTHKILQKDVKFRDLGLIIIDEEHRFGVRHKEKLKSLRSNVDILTLTATPIPRTLNMAMSGIRDISIIATPPAKRLSIKTFVHQSDNAVIKEAIHRELLRGGQVFYLHNEVSTIEKTANELQKLIPEARISIAHGQMREKQLEQVMSDFYHKQNNLLVCTTIIETGIDIPSANTIIIDRADKFGLAQLHQLRGRVGRSHHQAYAYLLTPHHRSISADARKRLDAIQEATDLGAGFTLASHDLEIRGAGELLGDEQSGNMHAIGFTLYMDMLEEAVQSIKSGKIDKEPGTLKHGAEINIGLPALIPDDYLPDVHLRLLLYKRISDAKDTSELSEIQVEMIDRFGMLPEQVKLLMEVTKLKLKAEQSGIVKIDANAKRGRLVFASNTSIDPLTIVKLVQEQSEHFKMDGADKLQFIFDMEAYGDRISTITEILGLLSKSRQAH